MNSIFIDGHEWELISDGVYKCKDSFETNYGHILEINGVYNGLSVSGLVIIKKDLYDSVVSPVYLCNSDNGSIKFNELAHKLKITNAETFVRVVTVFGGTNSGICVSVR